MTLLLLLLLLIALLLSFSLLFINNNNNFYNMSNNMEQGHSYSSNNGDNINNYAFSMQIHRIKKIIQKKGVNNYPQNDRRKK